MTAARLSPEAWIAAAFRRIGNGGIAAVRVEVLARDLGVSKGSFYWHFRDLPDLKARMLSHWQDQATARIVAMADAAGSAPGTRLSRLLELATSDLADPYGGLSTEAAIRDWARTDPQAARAQARTDSERLAYVRGLMLETGVAADEAERVARLLMMAYTGAVHRGIEDRAALSADLSYLLGRLLPGLNPKGQR